MTEPTQSQAASRLDPLRPIPGPDPGACPKCGKWRKAGMTHECKPRKAAAVPQGFEESLVTSEPPQQAASVRDYPRWYKRLRLAVALREWPWRIPAEVVRGIGLRRPPESVFQAFRRLHGLADK